MVLSDTPGSLLPLPVRSVRVKSLPTPRLGRLSLTLTGWCFVSLDIEV